MKRSNLKELAEQTVAIVQRGHYETADGQHVDLASQVRACVDGTKFLTPTELKARRRAALEQPSPNLETRFEVVNETTLAGIARLTAAGCERLAALNFASAMNPGGGFLNGSKAQEESLARSSALYASLQQARTFYEQHRANPSFLYSDAMILSPDCPIFRRDDGTLLAVPERATFLTSAAPNAGAMLANRREELEQVPTVFRRRIDLVLGLAASEGHRTLVLGAWGCGVFRNDPALVANLFAEHLRTGHWVGRFAHVCFSVRDTTPDLAILTPFQTAFA